MLDKNVPGGTAKFTKLPMQKDKYKFRKETEK